MFSCLVVYFYTCRSPFLLCFQLTLQSSNPPFTSIELDHSDSGREGCTVTTLTVSAEPKNWQSAIKVAVQEVCTVFQFYLLSMLSVV